MDNLKPIIIALIVLKCLDDDGQKRSKDIKSE